MVQSFAFFAEPVEKDLLKSYYIRLNRGILRDTDLAVFQDTFRAPLNSLCYLGTFLFPQCCPFSLRKAELSSRIMVCRNSSTSLDKIVLRIAVLAQTAPKTDLHDVLECVFAYLVEAVSVDPNTEAEILELHIVQKLRAIIEAGQIIIGDNLAKLILNLLRSSQSELLTASLLANTVLSNWMRSGFTPSTRKLVLDFLSVFFPQLSVLQPFNKLLAKRILLVQVFEIKELLLLHTDHIQIRDEALEPFLFFCRKTIRRLSLEESVALLEAVIWGIFGESCPILQKLFLSLLSVGLSSIDLLGVFAGKPFSQLH